MSGNRPIPGKAPAGGHEFGSSFAASFLSSSPLAQEVVARDLAECSDEEDVFDDEAVQTESMFDEDDDPILYRRPSGIAYGTTRPILGPHALEEPILTRVERDISRDAERSLLRDNHFLPPKHPVQEHPSLAKSLYKKLFSTKIRRAKDDEESASPPVAAIPEETSPLLRAAGRQIGEPDHLNEQWEAAVAAGQIKTTWQREAKTIAIYSRSLIVTFLLQYSINVVSIFAVGRIGSLELGAVSLATMTANITAYAPLQGLATSLDTLCAQAYGSGHKHLVGLQFQRMSCFLMLLLVPIAVLWLYAEPILASMIPEARSAALAAQYLHIIILGTPAFVLFEGGKRFMQAQGIFQATTYVLLIAAPLNILMNWLFVWHFGWGFIGAPIAVVATQNLLPLLLFLYVWKIDGAQCWGGFTRRAFTNWWTMIRLALPGMIMVEAEWFAFEILTLASGQLGTNYLAAQSILVTLTSTTFQIPFPMSIAGSTRVANLIGANLIDAAKTSARVTFVGGVLIGFFNLALVQGFRYQIPQLFTKDPEVIEIVASVMPVVSFMQVFDGLSAVSHGLLRGIGRQEFGGYANLVCYYLLALPLSFGTGFGLGWKLSGLWFGVTIGLATVSMVEYWFLYRLDWERAAKDAERRAASG